MNRRNEEILLEDLKKHGSQNSWDWQADRRFAVAIGDMEAAKDIEILLRTKTVLFFQKAFHKWAVGKIKKKRLCALRSLVYQGRVDSCWLGTGEYGVAEFGVNRVRRYTLKRRRGIDDEIQRKKSTP